MPVLQADVENVLGECDVTPSDAKYAAAILVATASVENYIGFPIDGAASDIFYVDSEGFNFLRLPRPFAGVAVVEDDLNATVIAATDLASYGDKAKIRRKSTEFAAGFLRWKVTVDTSAVNAVAENVVATVAARAIRQTQALEATASMAGFTQVALDGRSATVAEGSPDEMIAAVTLNKLDQYALDIAFNRVRARNVRL